MINGPDAIILDTGSVCLGPLTFDLASLLYDPKILLDNSTNNALIRLYSLMTGHDYYQLKIWTRVCGKLFLMKLAGKSYKKFADYGNYLDKEIGDKAIKRLNTI